MMKEYVCALHARAALLAALRPLKFFEKEIRQNFKSLWNYHLLLADDNDSLLFFPYIVATGGIHMKFRRRNPLSGKSKIHLGKTRNEVKDPVNIIAYGFTRKDFINQLQRENQKWQHHLGTCYFLRTSSGWHPSIALKIDIDTHTGERYHARVFEITTQKGNVATVCAAHRDNPRDEKGEHPAPKSFDEPRNLIARNLSHFPQYLTQQITEVNWRDVETDGKILVITKPPHEKP